MILRRSLHVTALLALAACGGQTTIIEPDPNEVVTVEVTPDVSALMVGETVQLTASALNSAGVAVTGQTVTWQSEDNAVTTVDSNGLATGVGTGTADVTATVSGVSGSSRLTITGPPCATRTEVVLAPNESVAYDGTECLLLPAGSAGDLYRIAVVRRTPISDSLDVPDVALEIEPVTTTAATSVQVPPQLSRTAVGPVAAPTTRLDASRLLESVDRMEANRRFHYELREAERRLFGAGGYEMASRPSRAPGLTSHPDPPARDDMYLQLDCTATPELKPVILIDFNEDIAIYQDSVEWDSNALTTASTSQVLDYWDAYGKQTIDDYVGTPSDMDGNGRIRVVSTPAVPANAAAAVYSGDLVSSSSCSSSNEGEVVYFAYDGFADLIDANPTYSALSVLVHEVKHVVSLTNSLTRGAFQPTWIEEGRAEISQTMSSRIAWAANGGPPVGARITGQSINGFTPENWGAVSELAGIVRALSTHPNSVVTDPSGRDPGHSFYATSFQFHRFIGDHYGGAATGGADAGFFTQLDAATTQSGLNGLEDVTGKTFEELLEELAVAIALNGATGGSEPVFTTWDFVSSAEVFSNPDPDGVYPWPVTWRVDVTDPTGPGISSRPYDAATFDGTVGPSGMRFHDFESEGSAAAQVQLVTSGTNVRIIVVRLN